MFPMTAVICLIETRQVEQRSGVKGTGVNRLRPEVAHHHRVRENTLTVFDSRRPGHNLNRTPSASKGRPDQSKSNQFKSREANYLWPSNWSAPDSVASRRAAWRPLHQECRRHRAASPRRSDRLRPVAASIPERDAAEDALAARVAQDCVSPSSTIAGAPHPEFVLGAGMSRCPPEHSPPMPAFSCRANGCAHAAYVPAVLYFACVSPTLEASVATKRAVSARTWRSATAQFPLAKVHDVVSYLSYASSRVTAGP